MSADFWAGYISGAVGILIGNPLDVIKVRLQAARDPPRPMASSLQPSPGYRGPAPATGPAASAPNAGGLHSVHAEATPPPARGFATVRSLATGTAAPVLGYGALNALLFVSYNRTEALLNSALIGIGNGSPGTSPPPGSSLWSTWIAGAVGGLATWVVSTPTELVKCRAQLASSSPSGSSPPPPCQRHQQQQPQQRTTSSWSVAKQIYLTEGGLRGFYFGGVVTALRDSIGYGFYFWSYELCSRWMEGVFPTSSTTSPPDGRLASSSSTPAGGGGGGGGGPLASEAARVLLCGGLAGVVTWASIFPLDTVKTRVQAQILAAAGGPATPASPQERRPLLPGGGATTTTAGGSGGANEAKCRLGVRLGAVEVARQAYREGGLGVFFRGLTVCSIRAFIVNAAQWAVYEWIMHGLGQGRKQRAASSASKSSSSVEVIL